LVLGKARGRLPPGLRITVLGCDTTAVDTAAGAAAGSSGFAAAGGGMAGSAGSGGDGGGGGGQVKMGSEFCICMHSGTGFGGGDDRDTEGSGSPSPSPSSHSHSHSHMSGSITFDASDPGGRYRFDLARGYDRVIAAEVLLMVRGLPASAAASGLLVFV
jgi:hypothetical protein